MRRYFAEFTHSGYDRSSSGGWFGWSGGGFKVRRLPHNDCRGMTKREISGKESSDEGGWSCGAGGTEEDIDKERSVEERMASSGTW